MDVAELSRLLDLPDRPTEVDVSAARRRAAKRLHPDAHGDERDLAMAEVNEACDRLIAAIRSAPGPHGGHRRRRRHRPDRPRRPLRPAARRAEVELRPIHAALTMLWLVAAFVLVFAVARSVGLALLAGSAAAATVLVLLRFVVAPAAAA